MVLSRLIRFIHWGIAVVVFLNLFVIKDGELLHRYLGYTAVLLVVIRLLNRILTKNHRQFPNKLALATYFAMWGSLMVLGFTGFLMGTDQFWGDELIENVHEKIATLLELLIVIHLVGIFFDSITFKRKTWLNMINGKKN